MKLLSPERLVFVDEAGYRLGSISRYGWAKRNERVLGYQTQGSWTTLTMLGAMALDGLRGFLLIESGTSAAVFRAYVTQVLGPNLREGDLVVMDTISPSDLRGWTESCGYQTP